MNYLALGDSMSIDQYTRTEQGGAVNQFARLLGVDVIEDLTYDGCTTAGVLQALTHVTIQPDVVTITADGNDLILCADNTENRREAVFKNTQCQSPGSLIDNLTKIAQQVATFHCRIILNTIYDPTDGNDALLAVLGFSPGFRTIYESINDHIRHLAQQHGFILADLANLFYGHGMDTPNSWVTLQIEPNLEGATAIAHYWHRLWMAQ